MNLEKGLGRVRIATGALAWVFVWVLSCAVSPEADNEWARLDQEVNELYSTGEYDRALIGEGSEDEQNIVIPTEKLGIKTDFSALSTPKAMVPYRRGVKFFHGGPSLQEAIVPVITLKLKKEELGDLSMVQVELTYKGGAKHITTRFPSVELSLVSVGIFDTDIEILLEAIDKKGNVVGEAKRGGRVDTGSGTVTMKGLEKLNVIMSMNIAFQGKFSFSAFDPRTMTKHASISMETDYVV